MASKLLSRLSLLGLAKRGLADANYNLSQALEHNKWCETHSPTKDVSPFVHHNRVKFSKDELEALRKNVRAMRVAAGLPAEPEAE